MTLEENEFTIKGLAKELSKRFKKPKNAKNKKFTINDVEQYLLKGYLPYRYGGNDLIENKNPEIGIRTITVGNFKEKVKNAICQNNNSNSNSTTT